jgi:hypothetical protein
MSRLLGRGFPVSGLLVDGLVAPEPDSRVSRLQTRSSGFPGVGARDPAVGWPSRGLKGAPAVVVGFTSPGDVNRAMDRLGMRPVSSFQRRARTCRRGRPPPATVVDFSSRSRRRALLFRGAPPHFHWPNGARPISQRLTANLEGGLGKACFRGAGRGVIRAGPPTPEPRGGRRGPHRPGG